MGYNKVTLYGEQICDYVCIKNEAIDTEAYKQVSSEPSDWSENTLLLSKFNNDLVAGDPIFSEEGSIVGYEIRRKKGSDSYTDYIGTIKSTDSSINSKYIIDYLAESKTDYIYYIYPSIKQDSAVISPFISNEVKTNWDYWSLIVTDESEEENVLYLSKLFKFEFNLTTGDMSNNAVVTITQNFTSYPTIQYGTSNYWSNELTSLCGYISCGKHEYTESPNIIKELKELTTDTRRKFLKDPNGNVYEVKITSPIIISEEDGTPQSIKSVKISWTETGKVSGVSVINNPNLPTNRWVLTETGEALPYLEYVWDGDSKWDNSYIWTGKNDILETTNTNMGRELK